MVSLYKKGSGSGVFIFVLCITASIQSHETINLELMRAINSLCVTLNVDKMRCVHCKTELVMLPNLLNNSEYLVFSSSVIPLVQKTMGLYCTSKKSPPYQSEFYHLVSNSHTPLFLFQYNVSH
eukprot:TRINITY_DN2068_c1_g1_i4.p1 TRINITY_DN2068_c1_g1~~TRINITY_DN2068_c1_g1_i4.p1  ORF type:complete len:123 (+),score=10.44 TRINITY_DN2068_c1_g1_i4:822-1190(+)